MNSSSPIIKRIEPAKRWVAPNLREVWQCRDMLWLFIWRDLKASYRQTIAGTSWAIIKPFTTMVVFSVFFGGLLGVQTGEIPYPIFSYAGLLPWNLFSGGASRAAASVLNNSHLIGKIHFPRLILPLVGTVYGLIDFGIAFLLLLIMMVFYGYPLTLSILWVPLLMLLALATTLGIGLWFAALSVQFRDALHVLAFGIQLLLFATPVIYPTKLVSENLQLLYALNPMVGVVEGFRWALLGEGEAPGPLMLIAIAVSSVILISGIFYFRRVEQFFADVI